MDDEELLYTMALTRLGHFNFQTALELYRRIGSGREAYEHRNDIRDIVPDCSPRLVEGLKDWGEALRRAEVELEYCRKHRIEILCLNSEKYPVRLVDCPDAPIVLYYLGNADLNQKKVISIVGTRHCTIYGADVIRRFIGDLKRLCPQVLIVSGLAYGVDVNAHRQALDNGYETVGVLAHGLDTIYPSAHRATASKMVGQGGLLTEFMTQTRAEKVNFIRRNRIVAGISDACILVESAIHGGGMITARISQDYNRETYAVPGRIGDQYSEGCNKMIRNNSAVILTSAEDFVNDMGWNDDTRMRQALEKGIERDLFPPLTDEQQKIVVQLQKFGDLQINMLVNKTGLNISMLTGQLFELEMLGVVKPLAGGTYHLLK